MPFLSFGELYGSNLAAYVTGQAYFFPKISRDFFGHFCIWLEKVPLIFYSFSITTKKNTGNHYFRGNKNIQQKIPQLAHKYVKRRYARQSGPSALAVQGIPCLLGKIGAYFYLEQLEDIVVIQARIVHIHGIPNVLHDES